MIVNQTKTQGGELDAFAGVPGRLFIPSLLTDILL